MHKGENAMTITRRELLTPLLAMPVLAFDPPSASAQGLRLELTPQCSTGADRTVASTEGPFFRPNSPLRHDLTMESLRGDRIFLGGFVMDEACKPAPSVLVELWHADNTGQYDNQGNVLRGHHLTDARGMWWFATIIPALYTGRTRHYHFKVQRPDQSVLTTQLYFPNERGNTRDREFHPRLVMQVTKSADKTIGRFDFVV
jgi:protocatechuate 3,4-dioxygenase beta subunit